MLILSGFRNH